MVWYDVGRYVILDATQEGEPPVDLLGDIIRVGLFLTTYTINIATHDHWDDIAVSEISNSGVTGYVARGDGIQLGTKTITNDTGNSRAEFDAADHVYTAIGNGTNATFDQIVIGREQDAGATDANTVLLGHATVASTTTNGGDVTLQWNAEGILQLTT